MLTLMFACSQGLERGKVSLVPGSFVVTGG